ncbi:MAG: sigma-70 family RNA polymerase sigma factor [bacterium]|nr:sigma-70 family RNA polymerase sigma factor [bacterium]
MSVPLDRTELCEATQVDTKLENAAHGTAAESDAVLVQRAQGGDYLAFEELVRQYRNDVFGLAYHFVHNREEAWDLSQEVFIKAHRSLKRFRGDASFKTWLLRITSNHSKDFLKKRRLKTVPFDDALRAEHAAPRVAAPDQALEARELGEAIVTAVDGLSHKHRTAFVLREFEGQSYEEMAETMNCSIGTVMSRLHHARKKLRARLVKMGVAEG